MTCLGKTFSIVRNFQAYEHDCASYTDSQYVICCNLPPFECDFTNQFNAISNSRGTKIYTESSNFGRGVYSNHDSEPRRENNHMCEQLHFLWATIGFPNPPRDA